MMDPKAPSGGAKGGSPDEWAARIDGEDDEEGLLLRCDALMPMPNGVVLPSGGGRVEGVIVVDVVDDGGDEELTLTLERGRWWMLFLGWKSNCVDAVGDLSKLTVALA